VDKKFRLPKEGFIDGQDVEGHGLSSRSRVGPGEQVGGRPGGPDSNEPTVDENDVEGHGTPGGDHMTVLPAPPSIGLRRTPGHGGELTPDEEDVEGHRLS
jgi:hypothetical protein